MTQPLSVSPGGAAPLSLPQRFIGMLTSPKATYENVVSWPRWAGMLALTTVATTVLVALFMFSEVGRDAIREAMLAQPNANPQQIDQMIPFVQAFQSAAMPFFILGFTLLVAALLMGVFAISGGTASFKQVLAVVAHSGVISLVMGVVNVVVNYLRGSAVNITSLAGLGQAFDEGSFMAGMLGALDLALFLWLFVLAMGLGVLYRRRTAPIFVGLSAVYLVIAVVVGAVKAAFAGGS